MRHRTLKWKFTVTFISMMALAVTATWCINNWFLEGYYQNYKIGVLEKGYHAIDTIVLEEKKNGGSALEGAEDELNSSADFFTVGNPDAGRQNRGRNYPEEEQDDGSSESPGAQGSSEASGVAKLAEVVRYLRDTSNITLLICDSMNGNILVSSMKDIQVMKDRVSQYIVGRNAPHREILKEHENYMIQKTYDPRTKTVYLESWGFFSDNGTIFIMTTPLDSIRESAAISNRFLMYVGIAVILVSSVILYFITRRVTAPIHELSQLSEKMSNLDFEAKYEDTKHPTEEISTLGNSMNVLSDKLRDTIGELKAANIQLQRDIEEKTQIDEMRKEFIANVSHELKTPIALIQGYAEGLTEGMAEEKESRDYYCEVIMDEAGKMNKMVKQLLTLTALEFGNEQTVMERFNLTELIQGVISAAGLILQQKQINVEFSCTEPLYVWGDEFKIEEVVTNYFNNALNHAEGDKKVIIRAERNEEEVRVTVFNTGRPIPEADIPNLWTKFFKVDKARTREYGGSGIGLSIVKAIMDSHHKKYGVRNLENGVEFWFTLDCSRKA